jgi:hypothetical protein
MPIRAKRKAARPKEMLFGVPNRDLSEEDYQALDADQRRDVRDSGLWDVKTDAEMHPPRTADSPRRESVTDA